MRIFVAYAGVDKHFATQLIERLHALNFEVSRLDNLVGKGVSFEQAVTKGLLDSEALLVIWSKEANSRSYMLMEAGFFAGARPGKPVICVVLDRAPLPYDLAASLSIYADGREVDDVALDVASGLSKLEGEKTKEKETAKERKEDVERSAVIYIAQSLAALTKRERRFQLFAWAWYFLGYVTIIAGLIAAVYRLGGELPSLKDVPSAIYASLLTVCVIGFIAAAAKFAFVLGRSCMVEALRNSDRTHAIRFGEFYLKAFGEKASWPELKEAFQYWNIDSGSTFKDQKEDSIDPQVIKSIAGLLKTVRNS